MINTVTGHLAPHGHVLPRERVYVYARLMDEPNGPRPPTHLAIRLPPDIAELLHRCAYETGTTKRDLVINALRTVYGDDS